MGKKVLAHAIKMNDEGHFYPLWGTCLGFQRLTAFTADMGDKAIDAIKALHISLPLTFTADPPSTRMYEGLGMSAWEFQNNSFTYNAHNYGVHPETFEKDAGLKNFWDVTSISFTPDAAKTPFVASIEAKKYPFFATQYHPEKPSQLWVDGYNIDHSWESIQLQAHFSSLFVQMARANTNSFGNFAQTQKFEISQYSVLQTPDMADIYVFN